MARRKIGAERREDILAAFERCIVRDGFAGTTLTDVANEAGQPRPLVRYFIGNRADMIGALIERLLERGEAQLAAIPTLGAEDDIGAALDLLLERMFDDETTNMVIMELWYLALRDEALRARLAAVYQRLILEVAARLPANSGDDDRAFAAVSLAFGAAFFRHLGLMPASPAHLRTHSRALLLATGANAMPDTPSDAHVVEDRAPCSPQEGPGGIRLRAPENQENQ